MVWPKEELVIRGYEIRRTDSFELQSEALMAVFDKIMDEKMDEAVKIAKQYVQDTLCGKEPIEKLVISKGCRPFNQYAKPDSQLTVQVAKKLMASGEQFRARDEGLLDSNQLEEIPAGGRTLRFRSQVQWPAGLPLLRGEDRPVSGTGH